MSRKGEDGTGEGEGYYWLDYTKKYLCGKDFSWIGCFFIIESYRETNIVAVPNFGIVFEVDCDGCGTCNGAFLGQEGKPTYFLGEKLNDARKK